MPWQFRHPRLLPGERDFVKIIEAFAIGRWFKNLVGAINAGNRDFCFARPEGVSLEAGFDIRNEIIAGQAVFGRFNQSDVRRALSDSGICIVDNEVAFGLEAGLDQAQFASFCVHKIAADAEMSIGKKAFVEGAFA